MAKRKKYDDDDGRVIVNMYVDGMPWYSPEAESKEKPKGIRETGREDQMYLTKKEEFWIFVGTMRAGLLVAGVFSLVWVIAILIFL